MPFYAVKIGKNPGIYKNWKECEEQVKGFSGAKFQKFNTIDEANVYMEQPVDDEPKHGKIDDEDQMPDSKIIEYIKDGYLVTFTDGSYSETEKVYTFGLVIIDNEKLKYETLYAKRNTEKFLQYGNISGEVFAVIEAISYAVEKSKEKLLICHDYNGIGKWARGEWKAEKEISKLLISIIKKFSDILKIEFVQVSGHSVNRFNRIADSLATEAYAKKNKIRKFGSNYAVFNNIRKEQFEVIIDSLSSDLNEIDLNYITNNEEKVFLRASFGGEHLSITYYKGSPNKTLWIQGNQDKLFFILLNNLIMNLDDSIQDILREVFKVPVYQSELDAFYAANLSNLSVTFNPIHKKFVYTSIQILQFKVQQTYSDYGHYTIPSLRVLEGVLKKMLTDGDVMKDGRFNGIFIEDTVNNTYTLSKHGKIKSYQIPLIENAFGFYQQQRHSLAHSGSYIGGNLFDVRDMPTFEEAKQVILDALKHINLLYS